MTALFAISYSLVLGRATPHRIIVGLVGAPDHEQPLLTALEQATEHGMVFHPYPSATAAEEAIDQQSSYAALVLGHGAPRLLVSSASGYAVARLLEQAVEQLTLKTGRGGAAAAAAVLRFHRPFPTARRDGHDRPHRGVLPARPASRTLHRPGGLARLPADRTGRADQDAPP